MNCYCLLPPLSTDTPPWVVCCWGGKSPYWSQFMAKGTPINHLMAILFCALWLFCRIRCVSFWLAWKRLGGNEMCWRIHRTTPFLQSVSLSILFLEKVKWRMAPVGEPNKSSVLSPALNHSWRHCCRDGRLGQIPTGRHYPRRCPRRAARPAHLSQTQCDCRLQSCVRWNSWA